MKKRRKVVQIVVVLLILISFVSLITLMVFLSDDEGESEEFLKSHGIVLEEIQSSIYEKLKHDKKTASVVAHVEKWRGYNAKSYILEKYGNKLLNDYMKKKLGKDNYQKYLELKKKDTSRENIFLIFFYLSLGIFVITSFFYSVFFKKEPSERTSYLIEEIEEAQAKRRSRAIRKYINRFFITILSAGALVGVGYYVMWRWQQGKLGPEENAAIITSIGSTITLGITLIVTAYFNKQTQQAVLNQSRATIRDKTLNERIERYPTLQKYVMELNEMVHTDSVESSFEQHFQEFIDYHQERKFYSSQAVKEYISHLVKLSQEIHKKEADLERQKFKEICQELIDQFDKELDLASLIDDDLKPLR